MSIRIIMTKNERETRRLGEELGVSLDPRKRGATVLALFGGLGGGKTQFVQGVARGVGITKRITSPTFVIRKDYPLRSRRTSFRLFVHLDFYRLSLRKDIQELDLKGMFSKSGTLVAVEWAERIKNVIPPHAIKITFQRLGEYERKIIIKK